jgi:hypothetical protein
MKPGPDDIELRLRAFRPRRPAPLPEHFVRRRSRVPFLVTAAVAIAIAVVVVLRVDRRPVSPLERIDNATLGALTSLALSDPDAFDSVLSRISGVSLPDVEQPGGVLRELAKP